MQMAMSMRANGPTTPLTGPETEKRRLRANENRKQKLVGTSATLLGTSALLVVTRKLVVTVCGRRALSVFGRNGRIRASREQQVSRGLDSSPKDFHRTGKLS